MSNSITCFSFVVCLFPLFALAQERCPWTQCLDAGKCANISRTFMKCADPRTGGCRSVGETWSDGCFEYTCVFEQFFLRSKITKRGCRDFKTGECKPVGNTWVNDCYEYSCSYNGSHVLSSAVPHGCRDSNGTCRAQNDNWMEGCDEYKCNKTGNHVHPTKIRSACRDRNGTCRALEETWVDGCNTYKCADTGGSVRATNIRSGCQDWHGKCRTSEEIWKDGCNEFKCSSTGSPFPDVITKACRDMNTKTCYGVGSKWKSDRCVTFRCIDRGHYWIADIEEVGCKYGNECKAVGQTWNYNCYQYECTKVNKYHVRTKSTYTCGRSDN